MKSTGAMKKFSTYLILFLLFIAFKSNCQNLLTDSSYKFTPTSTIWADSVLNTLSLDEKIAQLFMIRTYSNKDRHFYDSISRLIIDYNIGGLCFFQGDPEEQAKLTNRWQRMAKTPLLMAIDAEWGLGMRLDKAWSFPKQMTLGAMQNDTLVYLMGKQIGKHCKRIGIHMNFAPVVDINSNPNNPVINFRSFGENPENVAKKGAAYISGLQSEGVIATAKHFPGHGDTDSDSHYTLPLLNHDKAQIDSTDLYPFREAVKAGVGGIMVAHLFIPALDSRENMATSLSEKTVDSLLKGVLEFQGLAVTDALDMNGVTNYHKPGDIELKAFLAGNDILLLPLDIPGAINNIKDAIESGLVSEDELNNRCLKVLACKQMAGLDKHEPSKETGILTEINNPDNELINRKIFEQAITLVKNENDLIPIKNLDTLRIASLVIGRETPGTFQQTLGLYTLVENFNVSSKPSKAEVDELKNKLADFNLVIAGIENTSNSPSRNFGISSEALQLIHEIALQPSAFVINIFGNPYALENFTDLKVPDAIMISYEDNETAKDISAQMIFGAMGISGRLPVTATPQFHSGLGIKTLPIGRLKYSIPEELGITRQALDTIVKLVESGISEGAYPGAQVLLAKNGIVFFNQSFGYHTYDKKRAVENTDLYDLASLTKISATTLALMDLHESGLFDIDMPLSYYLPYLKNSNKRSKITRDILTHQAQFQAWIPFYLKTITHHKPKPEIYATRPSKSFTTPVAKNLYIINSYRDSIFDTIVSSKLRIKKDYKYSDLGYYLVCDAIERITEKPFDTFVKEKYYRPMGMNFMVYKPLQIFDSDRIVPTENDTVFRKQLIHGYVHDPGAAMLGGVSGHAGLFSNANDVAKLMQMYLQGGFYGGRQYVKPEILSEFTRQQYPLDENRRAIGFDKPYPEYDALGPCCESASMNSFGHSGFTGTYTWADPENGLVYVFLSNRVYPDAANYKLLKMNLRTDLHQLVYDIFDNKKTSVSSIH
ncbi:MAG: serine hydrolase [Bacteroidales bacterium]|nr:serine hydrolase [Bacteroidales bacterium]